MPAGRPTDLTPTVLEDVRRLLPTVLYLETVADYIGVHRITVRSWIKRGALEAKRLARNSRARPKQSEAIYLEFHNVVKKALAEGQLYAIGTIKKAASDQFGADGSLVRKGEWTAAAWLAERRFPEQWGRRDREEVSSRDLDNAIEAELERITKGSEGTDAGTPPADAAAPPGEAVDPAAGAADGSLPESG